MVLAAAFDQPECLGVGKGLTTLSRTAIVRTMNNADQDTAMPTNVATREGRIELRATKDEKRILAAAAAHQRLDVTTFIMRSALPVAQEIIDKADRIALSERDTTRILDLLENPPPPTPALIAAARRRIART